ncbi:MAG: tryptophan-rich sensory protein [Patescibacteria group bacterium]|nr:tryptophan-rich sensory protein [Patescibacteria group bacterium]MDE1945634.1 tryptophan-rich sensory protein [Patescibacteria group bacterium]
MKIFLKLLGCVAGCEAVGAVGAIFTTPAIGTWYAELVKPAINPPNWIFAPVWTTLFALMGVALFLIWKRAGEMPEEKGTAKTAIAVFAAQLVLNVLWSVIFFGLHNPGAAFVEIVILWLFIVATIAVFAKVSRAAAWFLAPYIVWVSFAAYLNFAIWRLNG